MEVGCGRRSSCRSASDGYNGVLMSRAMALDTMALVIRLKTRACPSTISMTMMKAVIGACVTAAKNPAIPIAMSAAVYG